MITLIKENDLVDSDNNVEICASFEMNKPEAFVEMVKLMKQEE